MHIRIDKRPSGYRVSIIAGNGEMLQQSEILEQIESAYKQVHALVKGFQAPGIIVRVYNEEGELTAGDFIACGDEVTGAQSIALERWELEYLHNFNLDNKNFANGELLQAALFTQLPKTITFPTNWAVNMRHEILKRTSIGRLRAAGAFIALEIDRQIRNLTIKDIKK